MRETKFDMISAAKEDDLDAIKQWAINIDEQCYDIKSSIYGALKVAARKGNTEMIEFLLSINSSKKNLLAILFRAARGGYIETVKLAIRYGVNITAYSDIALRHAVKRNNLEIVRILLDNGANLDSIDNYTIYLNLRYKSLDMMNFLFFHKYSIKDMFEENIHHPIIACVKNNYVEGIKWLIERGVDVNVMDDIGIRLSAEYGYEEIFRILLEYGGDPSSRNNYCLKYSCSMGHENIVRLLIEAGVNINDRNSCALTYCASRGHLNIIKMLMEQNINVRHNNLALQAGATNGHIDVVQYLLRNGANVNGNKGGALVGSSMRGFDTIVKMLLDCGANVGIGSALCFSAREGHIKVVELLIQQSVRHATLNSAFLRSVENGHLAIVTMLLENGANVAYARNGAIKKSITNNRADILLVLVQYGGDIGVVSERSMISIVKHEHDEIIKLLIALDISMDRVKLSNVAQRYGCNSIWKLLNE